MFFFFSSRRRHTRCSRDWSSDVCSSDLMWVDQFDTLGMGKDMVIVTGTTSDSMLIFNPKTEAWTVFRLPYPLPFYTRGLDGRIDNPNAGWKGRGIWTSYNSYLPKFTETKLGFVNHIQ